MADQVRHDKAAFQTAPLYIIYILSVFQHYQITTRSAGSMYIGSPSLISKAE